MANAYFRFKQFTIQQDACAMKVCTDACLFGAWCAQQIQPSTNKTALDIGTGTGLLALMLAQKVTLHIDAVEIDAAAAGQAHQNVLASPWVERINLLVGDVKNMGFLKSYDYIIANPPFYQTDLQSPDSGRNTAHHSQHLTLQALCNTIAQRLKKDGAFFLLLPYKRASEAAQLLNETHLSIHKEIQVQQTPAHAPFRVMLKGGVEKRECEKGTITIAGDDQPYTPEFISLLKDYYLYL